MTEQQKFDKLIKSYESRINKEYQKKYNIPYSKKNWEMILRADKSSIEQYWSKRIFIETCNFDINDWRNVRKEDYYEIKNSLSGIAKKEFVLGRILNYKNNNNYEK